MVTYGTKRGHPRCIRHYHLPRCGDLCTETLPPGTLGYPQYKLFTVCMSHSDVELHCLGDILHLGSRIRIGDNGPLQLEDTIVRMRGGWEMQDILENNEGSDANSTITESSDPSGIIVSGGADREPVLVPTGEAKSTCKKNV